MLLLLIHMLSTFSFAWAFEPKRIDIESKSQITIGGLFPMHHKGSSETEPCGPILPEKGIQRVEAMLYAIDEINKNSHLWNFDLGAIILDTCTSDNYVLEQSVQFLQATCGNHSSAKKVVGVVGASNSAVSESVANIFRLFKIPQVSYASTSEELDKLHKYPYFFRVVPSDKFQVRVIVDILVAYQWTYVSTVISEGEYGEIAIKTLQGLLANETREEICFAEQVTIPRNPTENDYEVAVSQLDKHKKSKVVIVFMNEDKVKSLLTAVRKSNVEANRFVWIGSDGWGAKMHIVRGNERVAEGAITILPKNYPIKAGFNEYFWSLKPETNTRNPWFKEFWEHQFNCSLNSIPSVHPPCTGKEDLKQGYHQESLVPMVIDSVNVLAEAIKSACKKAPGDCNPTSDRGIGFRRLIKEEILKTEINSSQGHNMVVKFDKERNIPTFYQIYQFTKSSNGNYMYREIGDWSLGNRTRYKLKLHHNAVWRNKTSVPSSACSKRCIKGEERVIKNPHKRCCWECKACGEEEYMTHEQGYCTSCPEGHISTADKTACKSLELDYMGRSLKSPWALVPLTFAILGLICNAIVLVVFLLYHKTPIIMAAGRELCYVILFGVALCYCFTFVALSKPSELSCGLLRTGMGLGLSFCYAAIFTKTNRISRIFNRSVRISKRPSYISPESQLVICSCLILIEVVLTVMWLLISPPTVKQLLLTRRRAFVAMCGFDGPSVFVALLYNMLLIVLCTYYAYKTRNIPENFNESKYISFAMYASCIVWLAFIPIHFSAGQDYKVQSSVLCMCVSVSGTVTLACLFLPKVYIVLCKPEKNVRYPSSSPNSSTPNISIAPVRFLRSNQNSPATPHRVPRINIESNGRGENFLTVNESSTSLNFDS